MCKLMSEIVGFQKGSYFIFSIGRAVTDKKTI